MVVSLLNVQRVLCVILFVASFVGIKGQSWVEFAIETQTNLTRNKTSIGHSFMVGTHNSYNSAAYGYSFPNQQLSITDQFNLGVRWLELDLHYIVNLTDTLPGPYRICHGSNEIRVLCETQAGWANCHSFGIVNYGEDTGCASNALNFTQFFDEISSWLDQNTDDVIVINFDDQISSGDITTQPLIPSVVNGWISSFFGDVILTPSELIGLAEWPSMEYLLMTNNRVILNTNGHTFGGEFIHSDLRGFKWPTSKAKYFSGYPSCTSLDPGFTGGSNPEFGFFQEDQVVITLPFFGTVYNGPADVGVFNETSASQVVRCGYSLFLDMVSENSMKYAVWSWQEGHPTAGNTQCASINTTTSRWVSENCTGISHRFACRSTQNSSLWIISDFSSTRPLTGNDRECPSGYEFSTPENSFENHLLVEAIKANSQIDGNVWISMNNYDEGSWTTTTEKHLISYTHTITSFGRNSYGALGLNSKLQAYLPNTIKFSDEAIASVFVGLNHAFVLSESGNLYASGRNDYGQLGLADLRHRFNFTRVFWAGASLPRSTQVAVGSTHTLLLTGNKLFVLGSNDRGQLGIGETLKKSLPTLLPLNFTNSAIRGISAGYTHSLLWTDTTLYGFGGNFYMQTGVNKSGSLYRPHLAFSVPAGDSIMAAAAGGYSSILWTVSGNVYAFGYNGAGNLGLGHNIQKQAPTLVSALLPSAILGDWVVSASLSHNHAIFLTAKGKVYSAGFNGCGQLGLNDTNNRSKATVVPFFNTSVMGVSAGSKHSLVWTNQQVFVFGCDDSTQLGLTTSVKQIRPTPNPFYTSPKMITSAGVGGTYSIVAIKQ